MAVIKRFIDGEWVPVAVGQQGVPGPQGVPGLADPTLVDLGTLANVDTSGQSGDDLLRYDGSDWVPDTLNTDDVAEAGNLYYTDARVETVIANSDTDDLAEGSTNLYYTDARVQAIAAPLLFTENVQTGNYTLALDDVAKVVAMNNGSAATVTVPPNSSVAFEVGTVVNVYAMTGKTVTVEGGSGVTVRNAGDIADQYVEVSLRKRATDEWVLSGNVA